jgi:hypothetical protein
MVTDCIIVAFISYEYTTRSNSCEVHTVFKFHIIAWYSTTCRLLQVDVRHDCMLQFGRVCVGSPSHSGHFNFLNRLALVGPQYQSECGRKKLLLRGSYI